MEKEYVSDSEIDTPIHLPPKSCEISGRSLLSNGDKSSPEERLAVMRAEQLVGIHKPEEYEETRQEVISKLHPKTKELWLRLEKDYDCEVCELEYEEKGIYGFKIRTPKGAFLDYATAKEIIKHMDGLNIK